MAIKYRFLLLGVAFLLAFSALSVLELFPFPKDNALTEKNSEFSGVLRLWISEENSPSGQGLSAWLTKEGARFEKKYDGVYVQVTPVSAATLSSFSYTAEFPPDMIVFSPGMLQDAQGLIQIEAPSILRAEYQSYASGFCTPIAMGASFWAIREGKDTALSGKTLLFETGREQAALYSIRRDLSGQNFTGMKYGVDLGLPIYDEKSTPAPTHEVGEIIPGADSRISENATAFFIKGEGDALFLSQRSLSSLTDAPGAPEFDIAMTGDLYIDQLSLFAVTDTRDGEARLMCERFLAHLLSEDAQKRLESTKAFSVTDAQLYNGKAHFQEIEMLLSALKIIPAPAFSHDNENATANLEAVIRGEKRLSDVLRLTEQP